MKNLHVSFISNFIFVGFQFQRKWNPFSLENENEAKPTKMKFSDSDHSMSIVFDFFINETQKQSFRFTQTPSFKIMPTTSPPTSDDDEPLNPVLLQDGVSATASRSRGNESPQAIQTNRLSKQESKELQSVVAVFVYDSNTESMRTVQQQNYIEQVFHGDTTKDIGSQLLLLVEGVHPRYAKMYYSIQNNSDPSKSPSVKKTICPLYSPNNNTKELVTGININVEFLQRATLNNKKLIDGRALQNLASFLSYSSNERSPSNSPDCNCTIRVSNCCNVLSFHLEG